MSEAADKLKQLGYEVLEEGTCECIGEPCGDNGLEGFNKDVSYEYLSYTAKNGKIVVRVYHDPEYYETCGPNVFDKHFKRIKSSS